MRRCPNCMSEREPYVKRNGDVRCRACGFVGSAEAWRNWQDAAWRMHHAHENFRQGRSQHQTCGEFHA